jgi:hypothetical protein
MEHFPEQVNTSHIGEKYPSIGLMRQYVPNWRGDVGGRQACRGYLIEKRCEEMMVASIEDRDLCRSSPKGTGRVETGEPGANNHDMGRASSH